MVVVATERPMLILFCKAEQLGLFDAPVHVSATVRKDGAVIPAHVQIRKVRQQTGVAVQQQHQSADVRPLQVQRHPRTVLFTDATAHPPRLGNQGLESQMGISYTFGQDSQIPELRGVTCQGGEFFRLDGKAGEPDAVRFATRVNGKQVAARIAGKPELETALAEYKAAEERREAILVAIKWPEYQAIQRKAINARAAYDRASERGYPVAQAQAMRLADEALDQARSAFPLAAAYAMAEDFRLASNDVKSAAGSRAMQAIETGADALQAVANMKAEWDAYCARVVD